MGAVGALPDRSKLFELSAWSAMRKSEDGSNGGPGSPVPSLVQAREWALERLLDGRLSSGDLMKFGDLSSVDVPSDATNGRSCGALQAGIEDRLSFLKYVLVASQAKVPAGQLEKMWTVMVLQAVEPREAKACMDFVRSGLPLYSLPVGASSTTCNDFIDVEEAQVLYVGKVLPAVQGTAPGQAGDSCESQDATLGVALPIDLVLS